MNMLEPTAMPKAEFRNPAFLLQHIRDTMRFYHPAALDPSGGFYHFFKDDGSVYDSETRHLVSSTRFIFNYAMAYRHFGDAAYLDAPETRPGVPAQAHWDPLHKATTDLSWKDGRNRCWIRPPLLRPAFVTAGLCTHALMAGVASAKEDLYQTYDLLEQHFWEQAQAHADEASADGQLQNSRPERQHAHDRSAAGGL